MKLVVWAALAALFMCVVAPGAMADPPTTQSTTVAPRSAPALVTETSTLFAQLRERRVLRLSIQSHRRWTWYWQVRVQRRRTPTYYAERRPAASIPYLRFLNRWWTKQHYAARRSARWILAQRGQVPAWFNSQALCVHGGEGAWNANTGNGFGGGLQFMVGTWNGAAAHSHGRVPFVKTTGDIAAQPPRVQIYAAYVIVVLERDGWGQWPNTARACGLL